MGEAVRLLDGPPGLQGRGQARLGEKGAGSWQGLDSVLACGGATCLRPQRILNDARLARCFQVKAWRRPVSVGPSFHHGRPVLIVTQTLSLEQHRTRSERVDVAPNEVLGHRDSQTET